MNKLCKKIIYELQKRNKQFGKDYSCSFPSAFINICDTSLAEFASDIGSSASDVRSAVKYLVDEGYLEYITMHPRSDGSFFPVGIRLSHKGKNSREFDREERKKLLFNSVLIPIAVTLLTNAAVSGLKWLWPQIQQWISNFL